MASDLVYSPLISGGNAAAHVAYEFSDLVLMQPLSNVRGAGYMGNIVLEWNKKEDGKKKNCFGKVPTVKKLNRGESTLHESVLYGEGNDDQFQIGGVLTGSALLRKMVPNMYHIASTNPSGCVLHVAAMSTNDDGTLVESDYSDIAAVRETGFGLINAHSVQEVHDMAVLAHIAALKLNVPFVNFFDGTRLTNELARINVLTSMGLQHLYETVQVSSGGPLAESLDHVFAACSELLKRRYRFFEYVGPEDAERVVVAFGSAAASLAEAIRARTSDQTRKDKNKTGLLIVRVIRPWSTKQLLQSLPTSTRRVCVIDQNKSGEFDSPLFKDVAAAFHSDAQWATPLLISANIVASSKIGFTPAVSQAILANLEAERPKTSLTLGEMKIPTSMMDNTIVQTSSLLKQVVSWTLNGKLGADSVSLKDSRAAISMVFGPFLHQSVQQHDSSSIRTGVFRSDIRFGPVSISSEYPILAADVIACDDPAILLLPQCDILAQAKSNGGTKLLVNATWENAEQAEKDLDVALQARLAELGVEVYAVDANGLISPNDASTNWIMQACILKLSGFDYQQGFTHLAAIMNGQRQPQIAKSVVEMLAKPEKIMRKIELNKITHQQVQPEDRTFDDFVPLDMLPMGLMGSLIEPGAIHGSPTLGQTPAYASLLEQLFGERLVVSDTASQDTSVSDSLEACFGGYLVKAQARKRLVQYIGKALSGKSGTALNCSKELLAQLGMWHGAHDNAVRCAKIVPRLVDLLQHETHKSDALEYIYDNRKLLHKPSKWIIGGESWASDLSTSGLRHILASHEDINILILETEGLIGDETTTHDEGEDQDQGDIIDLNASVMSVATHKTDNKKKEAGESGKKKKSAKKSLGLYAMNYGTSYVASVSAMANQSQALRAFSEADSYKGPSVIIGHAPVLAAAVASSVNASRMEDVDESVLSIREESASSLASHAVETGDWPLYRWNPKHEQDEFTLDSTKIKHDVEEFMKRHQHFSMIASAKPKLPTDQSLEYEREQQYREQQQLADQRRINEQFEQLVDGIAGTTGGNPDLNLLILYGSDGGNASGVAEKLGKKAELSGCGEVRVMEANDFNIDELSEEKHLLLVLATAGQGEPCANAKNFSETLLGYNSKLPGLKYAVFGLGDSHYWGEGTADSAKYFCLNARQVDTKLSELGAERVVTIGLGDDQDDDGYEGALTEWEPQLWSSLEVTIREDVANAGGPPPMVDDDIKISSNFLRGMIAEGLQDTSTSRLLPEDTKITKFHGIYQQDLRTVREELDAKGLERAYSFMIRVGIPGGVGTSEQYIAMDDICTRFCNGALKLTTRQAYQVHGVLKKNLKATMQAIIQASMDTLAACGDVNRNIIANPHWRNSPAHAEVKKFAVALQKHLRPRTSAYAEIWLDKKPVAGSVDVEPIYGPTYLPRKFKIAIAVPPSNDVDLFAHCLGFIAIVDRQGNLEGYNICVGGGMGQTHGNKATYPRLSDVMGFCTPEQAITVAEKIVMVQRDHGDRTNRKHARLKYTVEDMGVDVFRSKVEALAGFKLGKARPFQFNTNYDQYGWHQTPSGLWSYTMFIENGYIKDSADYKIKTALREIAETHVGGEISLTATQNLIIGSITPERKPVIEALLKKYNIDNSRYSQMRLHSMACVALPTCALAMSESQTYLPSLIDRFEMILDKYGLRDVPISIRMTGCPNGCGRAPLSEIGFIGKAPGQYNLYLGAGFAGNRLNKKLKEGITEEEILEILDPMIGDYARNRKPNERFGDFCVRTKIIEPTYEGRFLHNYGEENQLDEKKTPSGTMQIYW